MVQAGCCIVLGCCIPALGCCSALAYCNAPACCIVAFCSARPLVQYALSQPQYAQPFQGLTLLRAALSLLARMRFTRLGSSSMSSLSLLPLQPPRLPLARLPLRFGPNPSLSLSLSQSLESSSSRGAAVQHRSKGCSTVYTCPVGWTCMVLARACYSTVLPGMHRGRHDDVAVTQCILVY
jgi:hypothetical protein